MLKYIKEKQKQLFHAKHELLSRVCYRLPWLLPSRYVFILTNLCNLKCRFCYQKKEYLPGSMTAQDWIGLARQLPSYARVTFTGGEPLLFKGFRDVFSYVAGRFDCNVITNGLLLNEATIDYLLSFPRFKVLSISIDDIGNKCRDVDPAQWDHLLRMLKYFHQRRSVLGSGCVLEAKTVVVDENAGDLLEIHRFCIETLGCDHHSFQFLKGSALQHADVMSPFEDIFKEIPAVVYARFDVVQAQLEEVRRYNRRTGKVAFLHPKVASLVSDAPLRDMGFLNAADHKKDIYHACKFPWSSVHINNDGMLFPCMAIGMGNVKTTALRQIMRGVVFNKFRCAIKKAGTVPGCNRCGWLRPRDA